MTFDHKIWAISIIIGLLIGSTSGYLVAPKGIDTKLYETTLNQVSDLQAQVRNLQNNITDIQKEYSQLENTYNELEETLQTYLTQLEEKDSEIETLENENEKLKAVNSELLRRITNINNSYQKLQEDYDKLLADYNMINGPSSKFASLNELEINFTTFRTIYNYTDDVDGIIAIYYKNGEPFKGSVSFTVSGLGVSISDWTHTINGQTYFHLSSPVFKKGPGIYSIKPGWIYDSKGFIIASGQETDKFSLDIEAR